MWDGGEGPRPPRWPIRCHLGTVWVVPEAPLLFCTGFARRDELGPAAPSRCPRCPRCPILLPRAVPAAGNTCPARSVHQMWPGGRPPPHAQARSTPCWPAVPCKPTRQAPPGSSRHPRQEQAQRRRPQQQQTLRRWRAVRRRQVGATLNCHSTTPVAGPGGEDCWGVGLGSKEEGSMLLHSPSPGAASSAGQAWRKAPLGTTVLETIHSVMMWRPYHDLPCAQASLKRSSRRGRRRGRRRIWWRGWWRG